MGLEDRITLTREQRRQRAALLVLTVALAGLGLYIVASFLPALLWGVIITVAISPLYRRVERRWPRLGHGSLLPGITTVLIGLLVLGPIAYGLVQAAGEASDVLSWLSAARHQGIPEPSWVANLPFGRASVSEWWRQHLSTPEGASEQLRRAAEIAQSKLLGSSLVHRSITFAFTLLALFFLLRDGDDVSAQMMEASDRLFGPAGQRLGRQMILSLRGTIDGLVLVGLGEGAAMTVVYVAAGVPHPLLLGALTAVAAIIPFGAAALFAVAALLLVLKSALVTAIVVVVLGLTVVGIADHLIRPFLIGGATRLPFLWVLIGILGGVEGFGLLGLFIGPATAAVLMLLWRELVAGPDPRTVPLAESGLAQAEAHPS